MLFAIILIFWPFSQSHAKTVHGSCAFLYKKYYLNGKLHKAFAMTAPLSALNSKIPVICGSSGRYGTKSEAISIALSGCKTEIKRRHGSGVCTVVEVK